VGNSFNSINFNLNSISELLIVDCKVKKGNRVKLIATINNSSKNEIKIIVVRNNNSKAMDYCLGTMFEKQYPTFCKLIMLFQLSLIMYKNDKGFERK
jgi:hypothetical protein